MWRPLGELTHQPHLLRAIELAGIWLATLHRSSVAVDRQLNLDAELVIAEAGAALVGHRFPGAAAAVDMLLGFVLARAETLPRPDSVLLHGDYHYGRVVAGQGIAVVGADDLCSGDLHLDLGYFCASLQLLAYRRRLATSEAMRLRDTFLDGYAGTAGGQLDERFSFYYGLACLKLAKLLASRRGPAPIAETGARPGEVKWLLVQGVEALSPAASGSGN